MASIVDQIRDRIETAVSDAKQVTEIAAAAEKSAEQGIASLKVAAENSNKPVIGQASGKLRQSKTQYDKAAQAVRAAVQTAQRWAQGL